MSAGFFPGVSAMIRRVRLKDLDASGPQHTGTFTGLKGEDIRATRQKEFGFTSKPPAGSHALVVMLAGSSDRAMVSGIDHPDFGARDLPEGGTELYDAHGNSVRLDSQGLTITAATSCTVRTQGGAQIVLTGNTIALTSATLTHNGKNIGATHVHTGVVPGGANTGVPS